MPVSEFRRMDAVTPAGEAAGRRLEASLREAIEQAEEDGLCLGMIVASLHQSAWWMHQRIQDD